MTLHEKIQELRKARNMTQEELAQALYVSRTAVSKWESGRGYPNIDSLQQLAKFFGVTVDELLSSDELLTIAQEDTRNMQNRFQDLLFGLLDVGVAALLFLPFFGSADREGIVHTSLLNLTGISGYLRYAYFDTTISITVFGILLLALQNWNHPLWQGNKIRISLILSIIATVLFIISQQPYASIYVFIFLLIKLSVLLKRS